MSKYLNCKVICTESDGFRFTKDKIYEINDGILTDDNWDNTLTNCYRQKISNFEELSVNFYKIGMDEYEFKLIEELTLKEKFLEMSKEEVIIMETKNKTMFLLLPNGKGHAYDSGGFGLSYCTDDLTRDSNDDYNIVKVYKYIRDFGSLKDMFIKENLELIWERENDIKEYTMEELQKKLGHGFKIIKE